MIRSWRLTPEAEDSLSDIVLWSLDHFGARQTDIYEAEFVSAFGRIADGNLHGRSARKTWGDMFPDGLLHTRVGSHVAFFIETDMEVVIVKILHSAMNLEERLGRLRSRNDL